MRRLQKGPWILGEKFSAADIMIGSGLNFAVRLFKMVPPRPSFDAYIDGAWRARRSSARRRSRRVNQAQPAEQAHPRITRR